MDFNEKLQILRQKKHWTQEELAEKLYVSRSAVSKWESGRGYPNIDSLKLISKVFEVSIDELISGEKLVSIAEEDRRAAREKQPSFSFLILDGRSVLLLFFPFFGQTNGQHVEMVSLLQMNSIDWIGFVYFGLITVNLLLSIAAGIVKKPTNFLIKQKYQLSLLMNILLLLFSIMNRQPYVSTFLLILLVIKGYIRFQD